MPGSLGYEEHDAKTFAEWVRPCHSCFLTFWETGPWPEIQTISSNNAWLKFQGIDYLKYDNCNNDGSKPTVRYNWWHQV